MTLDQLLSAPLPDLPELKAAWLVMPEQLADAMRDAQDPASQHQAVPVLLSDGRFAVCADLLSEIGSNGIFAPAFANLDQTQFGFVEVIDDAQFRSLLPTPPEEP